MISIKNNIEIETSVKEVWELFKKLNERYSEISKNHISLKCIEGVPNKVGSIYKVKNHFKGKILEIKYKLTEVIELKKIAYSAEFPHGLLGLKVNINVEQNGDNCIVFEEIRFGTRLPVLDKIFDAILNIYLYQNLLNIKNDQKDRLTGLQKLFTKEPKQVEEIV